MAGLSSVSSAAISRLRHFTSPSPSPYPLLPLSRRAAVLILLFPDRRGDLRVVLTIRSTTLRNFPGQAALPGGKADSVGESAWQTARREAEEEIGLPADDGEYEPAAPPATDEALPEAAGKAMKERRMKGWRLEKLAELPVNLAVTELGVRPCVGLLSRVDGAPDAGGEYEEQLLPRLDAREVSAVFTAPFRAFLRARDDVDVPGQWYRGSWMSWHEEAWRMHSFFVPRGRVYRGSHREMGKEKHDQEERREEKQELDQQGRRVRKKSIEAAAQVDPLDEPRYKVWGMTARILVDAARVAYGQEPEFEHNSEFGDEEMIRKLMKMGRLDEKKRPGEKLTRDVMMKAAKM